MGRRRGNCIHRRRRQLGRIARLPSRRASGAGERSQKDIIAAVERELEAARYEASLAGRRYELVDPQKRHVARELEARWNNALERVAGLERRIEELSAMSAARP